jgi:hypothetical protein
MTPFEGYAIDQEQRLRQEQIAENIKLEGSTDAALGCNPNPLYTRDSAYLDGFFAELRRRVEDGEHLEIRWLSTAFLSGAYDAPDYFHTEF